MVVDVEVAKANLENLIERAVAGEEIVIARESEPVVRLVSMAEPQTRKRSGSLRGQIEVGPAFFEPLPAEELDAWEQ